MSNRTDRERRRQRRKDFVWFGGAGLAVLVAIVVVVVALSGRGGSGSGAAHSADRALSPPPKGLPRQIAANLRDGGKVLDGSVRDRLARLKGVPAVVNQWASWCPNCKAEFGFFQQLARLYERRVAFLGLDSQDSKGAAEKFLGAHPVNYPSVYDPSASQALSIGAGRAWPTTLFFDRAGRQTYAHVGGYTTAASLNADIRRYALGS